MFSKPKLSGCQNKKRKAKELQDSEASAKLLCNYLSKSRSSTNVDPDPSVSDEASFYSLSEEKPAECTDHSPGPSTATQTQSGVLAQATQDISSSSSQIPSFIDIATWPKLLNGSVRDTIITEGPNSPRLESYPRNKNKRSFSNTFYYRIISNGEEVKRRWLVYSQTNNSIYCFCCKLFSTTGSNKSLSGSEGNCDWKHIGNILSRHETSPNHLKCYEKWIEAERRLSTGKTIDDGNQKIIAQEKEHWKNVLKRLLAITQYLAQHQMAFRGTHEKLYKKNNGNYLGLVELIAEFDSVMKEHISRVLSTKKEKCVTYLGKDIQNELLTLMGNKVREEILSRIKVAKYYALILDCTPDISRKEQLSVILRYVYETKNNTVEICESFLDFIEIKDTTGKGMADIVLNELKQYGIDISNCRGQGYDNGANMKGKHSGLQKKILDQNKRAFFVACGCHTLNLLISDAARTSVPTVTLFGTIQRLFVLFSSSTKRWNKLLESLAQSSEETSAFGPSLKLKEICTTRWEARIESLKAVRYQTVQVRQALWDLQEDISFEDEVRCEADSLSQTIEDFGFLVSLIVWYDVLFQINTASKILQSKTNDLHLPQAIAVLKSVEDFLSDFRENGFVQSLVKAKELADNLEVEGQFKTPRVRRKKKQFGYEANDEAPIDPQERLRVEFFLPLVDTAQTSVKERFQQLQSISTKIDFLFKLDELPKREELIFRCKELEEFLSDEHQSDIRSTELCDELISINDLMPSEGGKAPLDVLNFLLTTDAKDAYVNVWVALRILLTLPISVATAERSFSKLKLLKTYLRSTLSQENLNNQAILSIENDVSSSIDYDDIISNFASVKARKVHL